MGGCCVDGETQEGRGNKKEEGEKPEAIQALGEGQLLQGNFRVQRDALGSSELRREGREEDQEEA